MKSALKKSLTSPASKHRSHRTVDRRSRQRPSRTAKGGPFGWIKKLMGGSGARGGSSWLPSWLSDALFLSTAALGWFTKKVGTFALGVGCLGFAVMGWTSLIFNHSTPGSAEDLPSTTLLAGSPADHPPLPLSMNLIGPDPQTAAVPHDTALDPSLNQPLDTFWSTMGGDYLTDFLQQTYAAWWWLFLGWFAVFGLRLVAPSVVPSRGAANDPPSRRYRMFLAFVVASLLLAFSGSAFYHTTGRLMALNSPLGEVLLSLVVGPESILPGALTPRSVAGLYLWKDSLTLVLSSLGFSAATISAGGQPLIWIITVGTCMILTTLGGGLLFGYALGFPFAFWRRSARGTALATHTVVGGVLRHGVTPSFSLIKTLTKWFFPQGSLINPKPEAFPRRRPQNAGNGLNHGPEYVLDPHGEADLEEDSVYGLEHNRHHDARPGSAIDSLGQGRPRRGAQGAGLRIRPRLDGGEVHADAGLLTDPHLHPRENHAEALPGTVDERGGIRRGGGNTPATSTPGGGDYALPPDTLISPAPRTQATEVSVKELEDQALLLQRTLEDFGVRGEITAVNPGPVVTLYEFQPAPGIKTSRIIALSDDIARSMSALSARVAVIPGKNAIGIELPNPIREIVYFRPLLQSPSYRSQKAKLPLILGRDIGGQPTVVDLTKMPHLLIAGTTGSGKSVAVNTMILSLLYQLTPDQCRFIMVDPKMLELSVYEGVPHLLTPVVTDPKKAVVALKWAVREMEERYQLMSKVGVRNILGYNDRIAQAVAAGQTLTRRVQMGFDPDSGQPIFEDQPLEMKPLPYIVVIVDEMADLMLVAGKDIEGVIQRLAQMARAAGIHLIMATQRPSVDVITGTIKANFPTRVSFQVSSKIDSRTILGDMGAEQLLGQGDMLYMAAGGRIQRLHGPFVDDDDIAKVVRFLSHQGTPTYLEEITQEEDEEGSSGSNGAADLDPLFDQVVALLAKERKASTSFIQRHFQIGYNRAARIMDQLEEQGIVSPPNGVGRREVLSR